MWARVSSSGKGEERHRELFALVLRRAEAYGGSPVDYRRACSRTPLTEDEPSKAALIVEPKANADMIEGYQDGRDLTAPEPSANRSRSYRHGFMVGRAEKENRRIAFDEVTRMADEAMRLDDEDRRGFEPWPDGEYSGKITD